MRIYLILISSLFLFSPGNAQSFHHCGYDIYKNSLVEKHPELRHRIAAPFHVDRKNKPLRNDEKYTINVVVHNVYQNESQIKTDEEIQTIIDVLTENFRNLNENKSELRSEFVDVAADANIEFQLEMIVRVETESTFTLDFFSGSLPDNVKISEEGGSDAIEPDHFLNIWVCHIEGGNLLGYAYPPAGLDNWPIDSNAPEKRLDGVVIHEEAFKAEGTLSIPSGPTIELRGRTIVHEVGHYLGLRHIWGDGFSALFGTADCEADDEVEDTPNQGLQSNFLCDDTQNTCQDTLNDLPDMYENYMDYSSEICQSTFTQGQVDIMRSVIENERSGLLKVVNAVDIHADQWSVFPNPTHNLIYLDLGNLEVDKVEIRSITGQELILDQLDTSGQINLKYLPKGIYILKLSIDKTVSSKKIIKL